MLRPFSQHSTRTHGVLITLNFPSSSFTQNALFSSSCSGLGRGSMNQVTIGGKSISLNRQVMNINPEPKIKINVQPGQFDDAMEESKKIFQSLAEPIKEPLKQLYEERQLSSPQLRRERNINYKQQLQSNQLNIGVHKKKMELNGNQKNRFEKEHEPSIYQVKQSSRKNNNKNNRTRQLQQTDFVTQDINWSDFINSNTNELDQLSSENQEEEKEALRLELEGGDYDRYLSFPKSIQKKFNFDNDIANSLKKGIGQNPSYKLSEKKLFYETLFQNLNIPTQKLHKNKN
ncbi:hypothetical protein C1645_819305 [Glomus cerebriforme]|uniref:Uncharacterized protein n=1 Tax=Glomus cerebriforme TaxID=658196 RepID=A0A397TBA7_9GLOM|nr:hypothetical protein C1645_819305 [Glomus cerebriforme]